ncbi:hypothetical protein ES703_107705 [subsurface metagenome]
MLSNEEIKTVEECVGKLVEEFKNNPYHFYTEQAMHCYLYHILIEKEEFRKPHPAADKKETILLHKEYPTIKLYKRKQNKKLRDKEKGERGTRGHFDIVILDPEDIKKISVKKSTAKFRKGKTPIAPAVAIELALDEGTVHLANDHKKLADGTRGYLLHFIRDVDVRKGEKFSNLRGEVEKIKMEGKVKIWYVDVYPREYLNKEKIEIKSGARARIEAE